jgi:hypothetical protein
LSPDNQTALPLWTEVAERTDMRWKAKNSAFSILAVTREGKRFHSLGQAPVADLAGTSGVFLIAPGAH